MVQEKTKPTRERRYRLKTEVLIRERLKRGWSQEEFAERLGVSKGMGSFLERDEKVTPKTIQKIAALLDLKIEEFVEILPL